VNRPGRDPVDAGAAGAVEYKLRRTRRGYVTARTSTLDALVIGVDVQSGDVRGDAPSYALVALDGRDDEGADEEVEITRDVVSFRKLRRLIERETPAIVATDNAYELAEDKDDLVRFLRWLPAGTKLVQVTGAERPEPLSRVANRHGVPYGKKPMDEAEAAARLAARNVGQAVTAFTDTTRVKVARGRSTGKGGWSQDRYTRRIHGSVKTRSREVERALDDAGLDYDREVTEKYGGYANAVFRVSAPPDDIPVSTGRAGDTRVEMERERRDGIEFEPLVRRRDHVVVGIDPGTTTAVAVVGLDGNPLDVHSTRTADTAALIEWLVDRGRPVLVAADVTPMPETVETFRRSFDAAGWTPASDLPVDEKLHRTREASYDNDHERDALAAALHAHDDHADQFERIGHKTPPRLSRGEVIARVLGGEESVETVVEAMRDDDGDDEEESNHEPREPTAEEKEIKRLNERVDRLESHVEDLEATIEEQETTIEEYQAELSEARREERREARERREVKRLERENDRLRRERDEAREAREELDGKLERLKALWKLDHSDFSDVAAGRDLVPVKVVEQFTKDAIRTADEQYGLARDDVVYLRDASGAGRATAELLAETEPRLVLREGGLSDAADTVLFDHEVPVGPADDVTMQEVDDLAVARESEVEAAVADWEERAERRRRARKARMVDEIISEHRAGADAE
jgi:predicted RNase H-like nuclease (RuvC/YqgF family)